MHITKEVPCCVVLCGGAVLTPVLVQIADGVLVGEDDGLVLSDDLPAEVLPARRQLPQLLQLTHPGDHKHIQLYTTVKPRSG